MEGSYGLFNQLIVDARPMDIHDQDVADTERRLSAALDEALRLEIIAANALASLLSYIQEHLAKVRRHLETTDYLQRNLWRLHNLFCIGLKEVFPEKEAINA